MVTYVETEANGEILITSTINAGSNPAYTLAYSYFKNGLTSGGHFQRLHILDKLALCRVRFPINPQPYIKGAMFFD